MLSHSLHQSSSLVDAHDHPLLSSGLHSIPSAALAATSNSDPHSRSLPVAPIPLGFEDGIPVDHVTIIKGQQTLGLSICGGIDQTLVS
ncbi:unnamed protein product [Protopolystoma xenopodis]|uniref:Uncharacterized protein n=1 Tax=Protopolystoma xenopodis TaxID=117903 RepID=A0A448XQD7_9PLAT|nr:unnamed protein product [Protopolystoma xenopodis]